jgi:hypothetical protein
LGIGEYLLMNHYTHIEEIRKAEERFSQRASAYRRTTRDYQQLQQRFVPLAAAHELKRFDIFMAYGDTQKGRHAEGWRWSTRASYWTAVLTMLESIGVIPQPHDRKNAAWLSVKLQQELPCTAPPLTVEIANAMWRQYPDEVTLGILVTFVLGQRLSDVALIRMSRLNICEKTGAITMTLVEGKVIRFVGPYSLYLDGWQGVGKVLRSYLLHKQWTKPHQPHCAYLLSDLMLPTTFLTCASARLADFGLESRSVRRGGLQLMAQAGVPVEKLLLFSKHTSKKMLFRYLGYQAEHEKNEIIAITNQVFSPHLSW